MRRLFWFAVGAGTTVYVIRRSKAGLAAFLPSPLSRFIDSPRRSRASHRADDGANPIVDAASSVLDDVTSSTADFVSDFRSAQREREQQLFAGILGESAGPHTSTRRRRRGFSEFDDFEFEGPDAESAAPTAASAARTSASGRSAVGNRGGDAYDLDDPIYEF